MLVVINKNITTKPKKDDYVKFIWIKNDDDDQK